MAEHVAAPTGAGFVDDWREDCTGELGWWVSPGDWQIALGGYAADARPGAVSVMAFGFQRQDGAVVRPFIHCEADNDHPMTPSEVRELIAVLGDACDRLDRVAVGR